MPLTRPPADIILNPNEDFGISERLGKNKLINGNFDFWQRSSSLAITGSEYVADRWYSHEGSGGVATISRQEFTLGQTDVPNNPKYFMRHNQTTGGTGDVGFEQRIESVRTLNDQEIIVSFLAKVGSGSMDIVPQLTQHFGTSGSPSSDVLTAETAISINTLWNKYEVIFDVPSINGKVLGTNENDFLSLQLLCPESTIFTLDVAQVQFEKGNIATEYDNRPLGYELSLCQRYYEKSFDIDVTPDDGLDLKGDLVSAAYATSAVAAHVEFKITKRRSPSISFYRSSNGSISGIWVYYSGGWIDVTSTSSNRINHQGFRIVLVKSAPFTAAYAYLIEGHWTADAEL